MVQHTSLAVVALAFFIRGAWLAPVSSSAAAPAPSMPMAPILHLSPGQFKNAGADPIFNPDLIYQAESENQQRGMTPEEYAEQDEVTQRLVEQMDIKSSAASDFEGEEDDTAMQQEDDTTMLQEDDSTMQQEDDTMQQQEDDTMQQQEDDSTMQEEETGMEEEEPIE